MKLIIFTISHLLTKFSFYHDQLKHETRTVAVTLPLGVYEDLKMASEEQIITLNELIKTVLVSWSKGGDY